MIDNIMLYKIYYIYSTNG